MCAAEMWQLVHSCYGDELGLTSDDEDYVPPLPPADEEKLSTRLSVESFSEVISQVIFSMGYFNVSLYILLATYFSYPSFCTSTFHFEIKVESSNMEHSVVGVDAILESKAELQHRSRSILSSTQLI